MPRIFVTIEKYNVLFLLMAFAWRTDLFCLLGGACSITNRFLLARLISSLFEGNNTLSLVFLLLSKLTLVAFFVLASVYLSQEQSLSAVAGWLSFVPAALIVGLKER